VGLPVETTIPQILDALGRPGRAVVVAPPGSGKTTIVPLRILPSVGGKILVLEPRRLATRSAARRMADLLGEDLGETVGYVTRQDRRTGALTRIEVVTEGVLTRRLQRDPSLSGTDVVIFDEFHERNLQTDLGLAFTLDVCSGLRADLRIIVMSATLDADKVAAALGPDTPVITADARAHPIEVRWRPPPRKARTEDHAANVIHEALNAEIGDILVFLPGMREIERVARLLEDSGAPCEVHRLHGSLPFAEQDAALGPSMRRKVVLATDIAETSLTVEGVRIVVDSGLARAPRFDPRHGMTRLTTVSVSRASTDQRAGRAGRTEPGVVYRLWSKVEQGTRRPYISPEITQVDLAGLALELSLWGVHDPDRLTFLDAPPAKPLAEARRLLIDLGALEPETLRPTVIGKTVAALPLHPRLGRMVADAGEHRWLACLIAALVDDRDIMRGRDAPVDLGLRVEILEGMAAGDAADRAVTDRVRRTAVDLARRAGVDPGGPVDIDRVGSILALAYPDRLALRRGTPGRFQLRVGTTAWMDSADPLAVSQFLVVADLDGKRKDARIRLAADIQASEVIRRFGHEIDEQTTLDWEGLELFETRRRRIGGIVLDEQRSRPAPGRAVTDAMARRLRAEPDLVSWPEAAAALRDRVRFARRTFGEPWPEWTDGALVPLVCEVITSSGATGVAEIDGARLVRSLRGHLGHDLEARLEEQVPKVLTLTNGHTVEIDYGGDAPTVSAPVQRFFGVERTPELGGVPILFELLSPARRPVQVTSDLEGFWSGSWHQVRKEMAGRYPKHPWPQRPTAADSR
jgi:ATP-dependent helicase HrpB